MSSQNNHLFASLDLGSNTFRLMLARLDNGRMADKRVFQHLPRLSESLVPGGPLAPAALERAWTALSDFKIQLDQAAPIHRILAGATMAARLAADGPEFMAALGREYGWETFILSEGQEARLTASGVLSGLITPPARGLIFDIGGRSTEFIETSGTAIGPDRSLAMGVVELTEKFLKHDPPLERELAQLTDEVRKTLRRSDLERPALPPVLIGTAGTVTTVAALLLQLSEYDPERVNGAMLPAPAIEALLEQLRRKTIAERMREYGLPLRRADAIIAGLILVLAILEFYGLAEVTVSDNGLLEGLWLTAAGRLETADFSTGSQS